MNKIEYEDVSEYSALFEADDDLQPLIWKERIVLWGIFVLCAFLAAGIIWFGAIHFYRLWGLVE